MSYLLFAGKQYYPFGGAADFQGQFDTLEAAIAAIDSLLVENDYYGALEYAAEFPDDYGLVKPDWAHVTELTDSGLTIVHQWNDSEHGVKPTYNRLTREANW